MLFAHLIFTACTCFWGHIYIENQNNLVMSTESKDIFKQSVETGTSSFRSYGFQTVHASIHPDLGAGSVWFHI